MTLSLAAVPGSYLVATGDYNAFVSKYGYIGNIVPVVSGMDYIQVVSLTNSRSALLPHKQAGTYDTSRTRYYVQQSTTQYVIALWPTVMSVMYTYTCIALAMFLVGLSLCMMLKVCFARTWTLQTENYIREIRIRLLPASRSPIQNSAVVLNWHPDPPSTATTARLLPGILQSGVTTPYFTDL